MVPYWPDIAKNHSGQTRVNIEFAQAFVAVDNIVVFSKIAHYGPKGKIQELFA